MVDTDFVRTEDVVDRTGMDHDLRLAEGTGLVADTTAVDAEMGSRRSVRRDLDGRMFENQKDLEIGVRMFHRSRPSLESPESVPTILCLLVSALQYHIEAQ